jgi:hypothetical protein
LLGEDPSIVLGRFVEMGLLIPSTLTDHLNLSLSKEELLALTDDEGQEADIGSKEDLVLQLLLTAESEVLWQNVSDKKVLELSVEGRQVVDEFIDGLNQKKNEEEREQTSGVPDEYLKRLLLWTLNTAASGIIGNRTDSIVTGPLSQLMTKLRITPEFLNTIQTTGFRIEQNILKGSMSEIMTQIGSNPQAIATIQIPTSTNVPTAVPPGAAGCIGGFALLILLLVESIRRLKRFLLKRENL